MTKGWCSAIPGGVRISVQISPNAKKSEIIGVLGDALKIRLQAQPIEGKANEALVRFLSDMLDVPRNAVAITHGQTSKRKLLEISQAGLTLERVEQILTPMI